MKQRNRITIAQKQRLSLNLSLVSAIAMLKSDAGAIGVWLEEQAAHNPQLQISPPPAQPSPWAPRWHDALSRQARAGAGAEMLAGPAPGLQAHVTAALLLMRLSAAEMPLALVLCAALEPSGWLGLPMTRIAREAGTTPVAMEAVLVRLQGIEPAGLFARNLAECLRLQAAEAGELDPVMAMVLDHLSLVAGGDLEALAEKSGTTVADIALRIRRLRRYDPKPGARFQPGTAPVAEPDLLLRDGAAGPELSLNRSSLPSVALHPKAEGGDRSAALAVIRLLESRNHTLLRIGTEILRRQPLVVKQGLRGLSPMTMSEVASALGLHQSTISRLVQGTSVDTGSGVYWLRAMFSPAVRKDGPAGAAMRDALAQMIAAEDPAKPMSDAMLADALSGAGAPLARRTIAKYREQLGIPVASRRKQAAKLSSATRKQAQKVAPGGDRSGTPL
ncbi:RNA polymerase factor sigma-54 [Pseudogemmobacter bohemicus]|uniref:RNA polymerase factor sigma-54 n=1 Tax=Pseudogemmobacter bohemicus TaxID=2250708 RepID=UPI000DD426CF|nr:RNA polymerase sigma-54 factor [Pseudogemmobacter bohemicus]